MRVAALSSCVLILLSSRNLLYSQVPCPAGQVVKPEAVRPEIPDEPRTVDPATLVPAMLAKKVTVEFKDASVRDVMTWIAEKQNIQILVDPVVADELFPPLDTKSINEQLEDASLYLLLDRLETLKISWYVEDEVLFLTTLDEIEHEMISRSYNLSDLLDAGYTHENITKMIELMLPGGNWGSQDTLNDPSSGTLEWFEDALFIRQTRAFMRQCAGLLEALRQPSSMRFTYDPPAHEALRNVLDSKVSVDFKNVTLTEAITLLAQQTKTDIRIDRELLEDHPDSVRENVTLKLDDRKLSTVLHVILTPLELTWVLKDGSILITSVEQAEWDFKVAVYLIGDLCQNEGETKLLFRAIMQQTVRDGHWRTSALWNEEMIGHEFELGAILSPRPGVMIVREKEPILLEIKTLLDNYRTERSKYESQNRKDPADEIVTRYYRIQTDVADGLEKGLPLIVEPGSWVSESNPDGPGQVLLKVASPAVVQSLDDWYTRKKRETPVTEDNTSYSVLIIRHQRRVHDQIEKIFERIRKGDQQFEADRLWLGKYN